MLPAQTLKATGEIRIPDEVRRGDYDLICIGSPTWWRDVSMPLRSFLKSGEARPLLQDKPFAVFVVCRRYWKENLNAVRKLAEKAGGRYEGGIHFGYRATRCARCSRSGYLGSGAVPGPLSGRADPGHQHQRGSTRGDPALRRPARRPAAGKARARAGGEWPPVPRPFEVSTPTPASVAQVHAAFGSEKYWHDRLTEYGAGSITLDVPEVDADGTVMVRTVQNMRNDSLPGFIARRSPVT